MAMSGPTAVAVDGAENLYVTEAGKNRVLVYGSDGVLRTTLAGLANPISIGVGADGRIFVGNADRGDVEVFSDDLRLLLKLGKGDGEFGQPSAIALAGDGLVYVADGKENTIKVYGPDGVKKSSFGVPGSGEGQLNFPTAMAIDEEANEIVVTDLQVKQVSGQIYLGMNLTETIGTARVQFFTPAGAFVRSFGEFGEGQGKLVKPMGVTVANGQVYVSDSYQNMVQVFDRQGASLGMIYDLDHAIRTPVGIAIGKETGRLFVASLHTASVEVYGAPVSHTVTVNATTGGKVTPAGPASVRQGESLTIVISPDEGSSRPCWWTPAPWAYPLATPSPT